MYSGTVKMLFCQYRGDGKEDDLSVIFSRVDLAFGEEEGGLKVVPPNASLIPYKASSQFTTSSASASYRFSIIPSNKARLPRMLSAWETGWHASRRLAGEKEGAGRA